MRVAVVGCLHGELDSIYDRIAEAEREQNIVVDVLLVCGDFQTIRNKNDLKCMAVPDKYKRLGTFCHYYFGQKRASKLTILIGGNHEASNYLQTLPYGGWVAPNMYYLGLCSVIRLGGLRIGGISGIFKFHHAKLSHFECLPYNNDTMRSVYHMRETEVYKLLQLTARVRNASAASAPQAKEDGENAVAETDTGRQNRASGKLDIFMSHDWPINIHQCGNVGYLLKRKPFFRDEVNSERLGNPLLQPLVHHLRPRHWFAAHLHVGFRATVNHPPEATESGQPATTSNTDSCTQFQALDKVTNHKPMHNFLQVFDISPEDESADMRLQYDPEWLAILKKTDYLLKIHRQQIHEIDIFNAQNSVQITDEDIREIYTLFNNDLSIPDNFSTCEPVPSMEADSDPNRIKNFVNPQTTKLCETLSILDPNQLFLLEESADLEPTAGGGELANPNPDAINLSDCSEDEEDQPGDEPNKKAKLETPLFVIDTVGSKH